MTVLHRIDRGPLRPFVDFLWLTEGYSQPHATERILPTGCASCVLSLDDHHRYDAVSGARSTSFLLDTSLTLNCIGVNFRPGGAFALLGMPAGELQNLSVAPELVWGTAVHTLREQLLGAPEPRVRFELLQQFLIDRLPASAALHPAIRHAIRALGDAEHPSSVAEVVERSGFSSRRFIATFRNEVGLTPKVFSRLSRFRYAIGTLGPAHRIDWAQVALGCGYFDQAHFIHDFREFAGVSPSRYLQRRTSLNHIGMPD